MNARGGRSGLLTALILAIPLALAVAPASAAEPSPDGPSPTKVGDLDQLSRAERDALHSDSPKVVTVDPYSGDITEVVLITEAEMKSRLGAIRAPKSGSSTRSSWSTGCASGKPCWHDNPPGNVHYQFTLGVTDGTWDTVRNFYTGDYYAKLCWIPWKLGHQVLHAGTQRNESADPDRYAGHWQEGRPQQDPRLARSPLSRGMGHASAPSHAAPVLARSQPGLDDL